LRYNRNGVTHRKTVGRLARWELSEMLSFAKINKYSAKILIWSLTWGWFGGQVCVKCRYVPGNSQGSTPASIEGPTRGTHGWTVPFEARDRWNENRPDRVPRVQVAARLVQQVAVPLHKVAQCQVPTRIHYEFRFHCPKYRPPRRPTLSTHRNKACERASALFL
jgi:hypothetical protein